VWCDGSFNHNIFAMNFLYSVLKASAKLKKKNNGYGEHLSWLL